MGVRLGDLVTVIDDPLKGPNNSIGDPFLKERQGQPFPGGPLPAVFGDVIHCASGRVLGTGRQ